MNGSPGALTIPASRIWNICVLAHVDHGKTALSDALISSNNIISSRMAGQVRYLDSRDDEQRRGITMKSSSIALGIQPTSPDEHAKLVNLVDSPGHVDFSGEVDAALRVCDGALLVVDVVEGVCVQTVATLRAAVEKGLKVVLVLNKIDRLFVQLNLDPMAAYQHIQRVLEQVNVIMGVVEVEEMMAAADLEHSINVDGEPSEEKNERSNSGVFSPELGNVVFASALDGWAFRIDDFAGIISKKFGMSEKVLRKTLWGEYYLQPKTKKITKKKASESLSVKSKSKPLFVQFILANLYSVYETLLSTQNDADLAAQKREAIVNKLGLDISQRIIKHRDSRTVLHAIMHAWLPASTALLQAVVQRLPSAAAAQRDPDRFAALWPHTNKTVNKNEIFHAQRNGIFEARSDEEAPFIGLVTKMIARSREKDAANMNIRMPKSRQELEEAKKLAAESTSTEDGSEQEPGHENECQMVAFARILSGSLSVGQEIFCYGPKYQVKAFGETWDPMAVKKATVTELFLLRGRNMERISKASSGAIVGISGLESAVLKTATLSSLGPGSCLPVGLGLGRLGQERDAIVKVAVEPHLPQDRKALQAGLRQLNQADPAVDTYLASNGQHVVAATGELHLERCLRDLKERYAKNIRLHISAPIVSFRETVVGGHSTGPATEKLIQASNDSEESDGVVVLGKDEELVSAIDSNFVELGPLVRVKGNRCTYKVAVAPLPKAMVQVLDKARHSVSDALTADSLEAIDWQLLRSRLTGAISQDAKRAVRPALRNDYVKHWESLLNRVWSSGPRRFGPNLLVGPERSSSMAGLIRNIFQGDKADGFDSTRAYQEAERSIVAGFQQASQSGPLCEEPLYGVAVFVDEVILEEEKDVVNAEASNLSSFLMTTSKSAIRTAMLNANPRLMEALLKLEISVTAEALGNAYTVLLKRRGRVLKEEIKEGVNVFGIQAYLPVIESFGFADTLRKVTSGLAAPQFTFGGWNTVEQDPFWVPTTEEEVEDIGLEDTTEINNNLARKLVDKVRKRKGLRVEEKTVEKAEKQRTLSKKK